MKRLYTTFGVALALLAGCGSKTETSTEVEPKSPHLEANSIYYWKTVLALDDADRDFLKSHDIKRAYVRFFDVTPDDSPLATEPVIPNATLQIKDSIPVKEIIPTIYITTDALKRMEGNLDEWADKIVSRVWAMCSYNELPKPTELQLDCDWTETTREAFFGLCEAVGRKLAEKDTYPLLSATIRLHQLTQPAPPVDYGVMMVYNTGSFENASETNSILSVKSVMPYIKHLAAYPLHLDFAYPVYSWKLLFRENKFMGIIRQELSETSKALKTADATHITAVMDTTIGDIHLKKGDAIRTEASDIKTIRSVKALIDKSLGEKPHSNILYHLDSKNLSRYSSDEIQTLYAD